MKFLSRRRRSLFAQIRCGVLGLEIELGRFRGKNVNERICSFCQTEAIIEDEYHFIMHCQKYELERQTLFGEITQELPNFLYKTKTEQFKLLMARSQIRMATFVEICWNKRNAHLFGNAF